MWTFYCLATGAQSRGSLRPGDVWLKPMEFLAPFPFVDLTSFTAEQVSQRNTQTYTRHQQDGVQAATARHCFDSTPWTWAPVVKPSLSLEDTGGHSCRCTHGITWVCEHMYIHRCHKYQHDPSVCLAALPRSQALLLAPGVPSSLAGPAQWLLANRPYWHTCPAWTLHPPNSSPVIQNLLPAGLSRWKCAAEWPMHTQYGEAEDSCCHTASAPVTGLPPSAGIEPLTCFTHAGSSW